MTAFLEAMTEKDTRTQNNAITNSTSHNYCVDLFFLASACRKQSVKDITNLICKAYEQDRIKCLKIIFWAGDIRQGAGERRFFQTAIKWLNENHKEDIQNYVSYIPQYSRWDVLFELAMTNELVFSYILTVLADEKHELYGLLCKWLPRKKYATDKTKKTVKNGNRSTVMVTKTKRLLHHGIAEKLMKRLDLTPKEYRKLLVHGTNVVEQKMCAKKWDEIEYSHVPSVAMNKYNNAWYRNDKERFEKYLEDVKSGKSKINASAIFPHDIIGSALDTYNWSLSISPLNLAQIAQWNALPNWLEGTVNSMIPVCDTSGSMYGLPIKICLALGLYLSERNVGPFKDAFFTFSERPQMQILKGNINDRLQQLAQANWGQNTNLVAVFEHILKQAKQYGLRQEDMPKNVLVISDMEFDYCDPDLTNYDVVKQAYEQSGYKCPNIIFWNVNGRVGNVPVTVNDKGVALISGASPSIIKAVMSGQVDPVTIMDNIIESERYSFIK